MLKLFGYFGRIHSKINLAVKIQGLTTKQIKFVINSEIMIRLILFLFIIVLLSQCKTKTAVDTLLINGTVYTVDSSFSKAEAVAVKDGKIVATGSSAELQKNIRCKKKTIDLQGKFFIPRFY